MIIASACSTSWSASAPVCPMGCKNRLRATALTPRQTATLGRSMPSSGEISGRSGDGARELDIGTTTMSSSSKPVAISSTETTMAGRFLPGSPFLAAPSETSQISPRRGSVDVIAESRLPLPLLGTYRRRLSICPRGISLRAKDRLACDIASQLGEHRRKGHSPLSRLLGKKISGLTGNPDRCSISRHSQILALIYGDTQVAMTQKPTAFRHLSKQVRKRPGAAREIDARKRAIIAAVRPAELREQMGKTRPS